MNLQAAPYKGIFPLNVDLFCRVVDNFGDIGVCWRLACELAERGHAVRLWVDDASALAWMAPQGALGVSVHAWADAQHAQAGDVVIEAFGCEIDANFVAKKSMNTMTEGLNVVRNAPNAPPVWLNLEYLSAEPYVQRCHGLPSPVQSGPCAGSLKWFFYPGFTAGTGGLLREASLTQRQAAFDANAWLTAQGLAPKAADEVLMSLFCYEPAALGPWLQQMAQGRAWQAAKRTRLLVAPGKPAQAVKNALKSGFLNDLAQLSSYPLHPLLSICYLPKLPQTEFDHLLWACDFNAVRGEDSLVRALWAGKPLLWHIYPQDDGAHRPKLAAWLATMQAPAAVQAAHRAWNRDTPGNMPPIDLAEWQTWAQTARAELLSQPSLADQLLDFVATKTQ